MNLGKKKMLAARTFNVGKNRIVFSNSRLNEIKGAITKQDMRDLKTDGAISINKVRGRTKVKKTKKRGPGKIKKNVSKRKQEYVILTRKLRKHLAELKKQNKISKEEFIDCRKKIRNRFFRSKLHLKEHIKSK